MYKIKINAEEKLVKMTWDGKPSEFDLADGLGRFRRAIMSFKKGEPLVMSNIPDTGALNLSSSANAIIAEHTVFYLNYCRKYVQISSSGVIDKSFDKVSDMSNFRICCSEQAAMRWLLDH